MRLIERVWFEKHSAKWWLVPLLIPFMLVFWLLSNIRLMLFRIGVKSIVKVDCPVVVVGNIGVGGNGKTPVVIFLVEQLKKRGVKVGVISRGYGSKAANYPYVLDAISTANEAGDEPLLIYQRCNVPVVIGADRIASVNELVRIGCQIIISDDGLQHYRLGRDYELLIVDGKRVFGNGLLLPAGPLRESIKRLNSVDRIILNGHRPKLESNAPINVMQLSGKRLVNLKSNEQLKLSEFINANSAVRAVAGIGDPMRFFDYLRQLGFTLDKTQGYIDHQTYNAETFDTIDNDKIPLLMTEKDAVKCKTFAKDNWWFLPVDAQFSSQENEQIMADVCRLLN